VCLFFLLLLLLLLILSPSAVVFRPVSLFIAYGRDYYPFRWFSRLFFLKKKYNKRNWKSSTGELFYYRFDFKFIQLSQWMNGEYNNSNNNEWYQVV
jgi:hypothetical protein